MTGCYFRTEKTGQRKAKFAVHWTADSTGKQTCNCGRNKLLISESVGLKVTSIQWSGADQSDPGSIPHDIQYSTAISREEDIGIEQDANSQALQSEPSELLGHAAWNTRVVQV